MDIFFKDYLFVFFNGNKVIFKKKFKNYKKKISTCILNYNKKIINLINRGFIIIKISELNTLINIINTFSSSELLTMTNVNYLVLKNK